MAGSHMPVARTQILNRELNLKITPPFPGVNRAFQQQFASWFLRADGRDGARPSRRGIAVILNVLTTASPHPDFGAARRLLHAYCFMPVRVMPWMKYFWAKKKITITGTVISRPPAMVSAGLLPTCTLKAYRPNASGYNL